MKAIRIHQHGEADVLTIDDIEKPKIKADEILVEIKAASLNHLDIWVRKGIQGVPLPLIMGSDGCGIITEIGSEVKTQYGFNLKDEVFIAPIRSCGKCDYCKLGHENLCTKFQIPGESTQGTMAEYVAVKAKYIFPKPKNLTFAETAAFPLATLTAYHMLIQKVNLSTSQWILIYGASSGIGSAAIQIAKHHGLKVITTIGSEEKREKAKALGADFIINYKKEAIGREVRAITEKRGVDIVFEHPGAATWKETLRSLKRGGQIVTCGATTGPTVSIDLRSLFIKQQSIVGSTMGTLSDIRCILALINQGAVKPLIDREFSYFNIREAHHYLESGNQFGKIIINFQKHAK